MSLLDQIYERLEEDAEEECFNENESEIRQFFADQTLFITGISGFLGKCILEKLLRSCSDIKHIYVLMREHQKYTLEERTERYFSNVIFEPIKKQQPDFRKKVTVMKGDIMHENLGLSEEDINTIKDEVTIIYHNAAIVKFDERISVTLKANVLGTKELLELAKSCKNMKLFVYVSSAYSHCYKKDIEEQFYPSPADLQTVQNIIKLDESLSNGLTEKDQKMLIKEYPNNYVYSKAIAEDLIQQYSKNSKFAHAIYRPSIVTSAYKEPLPGWVGNTNGPVYVFLGYVLGFSHGSYSFGYPMDFIPCDLAVNGLITISRDAFNNWKNYERQSLVYNFGSSTTNPISLEISADLYEALPAKERSAKAVWLSSAVITENYYIFWILHIILHLLPACLIDFILVLSGKKPRAVSIWWKITQHLDEIHYFGNGNWKIYMPRTSKVIDKMNLADRRIFFCDMRKFHHDEYIYIIWRGLKYYILKEDLNSYDGYRRYIILWLMHYAMKATLLLALFYLLRRLMTVLF